MSIHKKAADFDVVVIGGGLSGMCAAIAAARSGVRTAIIQNRSMFGGNASSEIRMHIVGANCHSSKPNMRETGILEEILLENKRRNPYASFPVFDTIMWEKIHLQENLTSYLNTNMDEVVMEGSSIKAVVCHQNSTETEFSISGKIFVDATGHGTLGVMAGAKSRMGSESKAEFNEPTAPEEPNTDTMGNSMMFVAADRGEPVKFERPSWAYQFSEEDLRYRPHVDGIIAHADGGEIVASDEKKNQLPGFNAVDSGYWWIELGGQYNDIIEEGEDIRDELLKCVYGVWDHLKNVGDHGIENYDLDWVGMVPGYRESRRLEGDYILTENDIRSNRIFPDAVAYGAWPMDIHVRCGILDFDKYPSEVYNYDGFFSIPYRCYYSSNVDNLMMAGRDISTSKMAFGATRVMGTCAVGGQAVGTSAAMAIKKNCSPRDIGQFHIAELQQKLLKDDCFIPGVRNQDPADAALTATIQATSFTEKGRPENVINGISRSLEEENCWESGLLSGGDQTLTLSLETSRVLTQLRLTFDTDLSHEIMPSLTRIVRDRQVKGLPLELVKDYTVTLLKGDTPVHSFAVHGNGQRLRIHELPGIDCDAVQITVEATYGCPRGRIYEVRLY